MSVDPLSWKALEYLPDMCERCYDAASALTLWDGLEDAPKQIVFAASGISALVADGFQSLASSVCPIPVIVNRAGRGGYELPAFVGPDTLMIAISPSGTTQETIYALSEADERKARVLVITGPNGHLRDIASAQQYPILFLPQETLEHAPSEFASVFWMLLGALGGVLSGSLETSRPATDFASAALRLMRRQRNAFGRDADLEWNAARKIAIALDDSWPILYGSSEIAASAMRAWAEFFASVSRVPSIAFAFPELDSDRELPWLMPSRVPFSLLFLRDRADTSLIADRIDALRNRWDGSTSDLMVHEIFADGDTPVIRYWTSVYLGMWTAQYVEV